MSNLIDKIKAKASEFAIARNQELVDVEMQKNGSVQTLKIIVGSQAGPMVADLTAINKSFRDFCTTDKDLKILDGYAVEVCSPGLDRPLHNLADYRRNINRFIKVQLSENDKMVKTEFKLLTVTDSELKGILDDGTDFTIKVADIKKAQPAIRF